jgi:DNA ligase-1
MTDPLTFDSYTTSDPWSNIESHYKDTFPQVAPSQFVALDGLPLLKRLDTFIHDLQSQADTDAKLKRLSHYDDLKYFLGFLFHPGYTSSISSRVMHKYTPRAIGVVKKRPIKKHKTSSTSTTNTISSGDVAESKNTVQDMQIDATAIATTSTTGPNPSWFKTLNDLYRGRGYVKPVKLYPIVNYWPEFRYIVDGILDKDLNIGLGTSHINQVFPSLIPIFHIALAENFDAGVTGWPQDTWIISRKYDGVRCLFVARNGQVKAFSRYGRRLKLMEHMEKILQPWAQTDNWVLDGELCTIMSDGITENFANAAKIMRSRSSWQNGLTKWRFKAFDLLKIADFDTRQSLNILSQRLEDCREFIQQINCPQEFECIQYEIYNPDSFQRWQKIMLNQRWEGLMLRRDTIYRGKRSHDLMKLTRFISHEYIVSALRWQTPTPHNQSQVLKSVVIDHKGSQIEIIDGLTAAQIQRYSERPDLLLGTLVSINYYQETRSEATGQYQLLFPMLKYVFEGETQRVF